MARESKEIWQEPRKFRAARRAAEGLAEADAPAEPPEPPATLESRLEALQKRVEVLEITVAAMRGRLA